MFQNYKSPHNLSDIYIQIQIHTYTFICIYKYIHTYYIYMYMKKIYINILLIWDSQPPQCRIAPTPSFAAPLPRFGKAMAKVKSRTFKRNQRHAAKFLRSAIQQDRQVNTNSRENTLWIKHADLNPILTFLAKH